MDDPLEAIESCFDAGWTDGLPVMPPTEERVEAMLAGGPWAPDEPLLHEIVRERNVPASKIAANAVMAGCLPSYFPVVGAVCQAMSDRAFNLHGVTTSTGGATVVIAVNGPIAEKLGIQSKENLLGSGFRANATIGRAIRLVQRNCLAAIPGALDKSTQGWPGKISCCFAEDQSANPWEPYHVSRGFDAATSTVTIYAGESCHNLLNHGSADAHSLLLTFADSMAAAGSFSLGYSLLVITPEHARKIAASGLTRADVQRFLYEHARRSLADLKRLGKTEAKVEGSTHWLQAGHEVEPGDEDTWVHRGTSPDDIALFFGGGDAGGHSAFFPSWSRGRSVPPITREIEGA